jgi:hypothetical protein
MNERIIEMAIEAGFNPVNCTGSNVPLFEKFAELIVQECISSVGSQADKAYLKKHFGLPVESDIVYPATEESWSVKSQYNREYNFPK